MANSLSHNTVYAPDSLLKLRAYERQAAKRNTGKTRIDTTSREIIIPANIVFLEKG